MVHFLNPLSSTSISPFGCIEVDFAFSLQEGYTSGIIQLSV